MERHVSEWTGRESRTMSDGDRVIRQIVAASVRVGAISEPVLFALCGDGTLWRLDEQSDSEEWTLVRRIPQDAP